MDKKIKEIEEGLLHPMFLKEPGKHLQSGQARDDIKYLLSKIKELEQELLEMVKCYCSNAGFWEVKIKELKAHAVDLGNKLFNIINEKLKLEERIKLAEATRDDALAYSKMFKIKIGELEEGIEKHKKKYEIVEMFDEKIVKRYITREDEELYKLIKKEN